MAVLTSIQVNAVGYVLNKQTVKKILDVCQYNGSMYFLY